MNYYDFLNKVLSSADGKDFAKKNIEYTQKTEQNPYLGSLFNKSKDSAVKVDDTAIFHNAKKEDYTKINYEKIADETDETKAKGNEKTDEKMSALEFVIKSFVSIDKIKELVDKNKDGKLSVEELKNFVEKELAGKDKNIEDISLEDFEAVIKENEIDLEEVLKEKETEETQSGEEETISEEQTPSVSGGGGAGAAGSVGDVGAASDVGGAGNAGATGNTDAVDNIIQTPTAGNVATIDAKIEQITAKIGQLDTQERTQMHKVQQKKDALNAVLNGTNPRIQEAVKAEEAAKKEYENALASDPGLEKYKDDIKANLDAIDANAQAIDENTKAITEKEEQISNITAEIESLKSSLAGIRTEYDSLKEKSIPADATDEQKAAIQKSNAQIRAQKASLKQKLDTLEQEVKDKEAQKTQFESELEALNNEKTELEAEKTQLEEDKAELDRLVKEYGNEVTQKALEAYNEARENVQKVKSEELQKAKAELEAEQKKLQEIQTEKAKLENEKKALIDEKIAQERAEAGELDEQSELDTDYQTRPVKARKTADAKVDSNASAGIEQRRKVRAEKREQQVISHITKHYSIDSVSAKLIISANPQLLNEPIGSEKFQQTLMQASALKMSTAMEADRYNNNRNI